MIRSKCTKSGPWAYGWQFECGIPKNIFRWYIEIVYLLLHNVFSWSCTSLVQDEKKFMAKFAKVQNQLLISQGTVVTKSYETAIWSHNHQIEQQGWVPEILKFSLTTEKSWKITSKTLQDRNGNVLSLFKKPCVLDSHNVAASYDAIYVMSWWWLMGFLVQGARINGKLCSLMTW